MAMLRFANGRWLTSERIAFLTWRFAAFCMMASSVSRPANRSTFSAARSPQGLILVEGCLVLPTGNNAGQQMTENARIDETGVHSLPARLAMDVGCVAHQEQSSLTIRLSKSMMQTEA
jgi:hypothetical protein